MKRKGLAIAGLVAGLSVLSSMSAFAGEWKQDERGWWWQNDDGSYPVSTWQWIDGNKDGLSESYYFNEAGYLVTNTTIDGYTVNADGAWIENGIVQTQSTSSQQEQITSASGMFTRDENGWWWQNDDKSYPVNQWLWIDGDKDGVSERFYFGSDGYMLMNTTTPDNCQVNERGAWIVDGVVQTQGERIEQPQQEKAEKHRWYHPDLNPYLGDSTYEQIRTDLFADLNKSISEGFGSSSFHTHEYLIATSIAYSTDAEEKMYMAMTKQVGKEIADYLYFTYGWETDMEKTILKSFLASSNMSGDWNPGMQFVLK